jgi:hypothetical protein
MMGSLTTDRRLNQTEEVDQYLHRLEHPLKAEIEQVRAIILGADKGITEHIKWNAPSFCYQGEDGVTFNLRPQDRIQLIFHRGAKARKDSDFVFEDPSEMLKWASTDRAILTLKDMEEVETKKSALEKLVSQWMKSTASG